MQCEYKYLTNKIIHRTLENIIINFDLRGVFSSNEIIESDALNFYTKYCKNFMTPVEDITKRICFNFGQYRGIINFLFSSLELVYGKLAIEYYIVEIIETLYAHLRYENIHNIIAKNSFYELYKSKITKNKYHRFMAEFNANTIKCRY